MSIKAEWSQYGGRVLRILEAIGPSQTRVGSEILCGRGGRVHEGRFIAFGHSSVIALSLRFFRFGRLAVKLDKSMNGLSPTTKLTDKTWRSGEESNS